LKVRRYSSYSADYSEEVAVMQSLTLYAIIVSFLNLRTVLGVFVQTEEIVNFTTGYVQDVPLPGSLANWSTITPSATGSLIASMLLLNISSLDETNITISLDDTTNPCFKWSARNPQGV
jgi:hypothetical protein